MLVESTPHTAAGDELHRTFQEQRELLFLSKTTADAKYFKQNTCGLHGVTPRTLITSKGRRSLGEAVVAPIWTRTGRRNNHGLQGEMQLDGKGIGAQSFFSPG